MPFNMKKDPLASQQTLGPIDILPLTILTAIPSLICFWKTTETTLQQVQILSLNSISMDISLKMTWSDTLDSYSVKALLDSGTTDNFLDWKYIKRHQQTN